MGCKNSKNSSKIGQKVTYESDKNNILYNTNTTQIKHNIQTNKSTYDMNKWEKVNEYMDKHIR